MTERKQIIRNLRIRAGLSKGQAAKLFGMGIQEWEKFESGYLHDIPNTSSMFIFQKLYRLAEESERRRINWPLAIMLTVAAAMVVAGLWLLFTQ